METPPPPGQLMLQAVRIILECNLVIKMLDLQSTITSLVLVSDLDSKLNGYIVDSKPNGFIVLGRKYSHCTDSDSDPY